MLSSLNKTIIKDEPSFRFEELLSVRHNESPKCEGIKKMAKVLQRNGP